MSGNSFETKNHMISYWRQEPANPKSFQNTLIEHTGN